MSHIDPFNPPPDRGHVRCSWPIIRRTVVEAVERASNGAATLEDVEEAARLAGVDRFTFPAVVRRLEGEEVVRIERTPGRGRVRLALDSRRSATGKVVARSLGEMAAHGLDMLDGWADGRTTRRARRAIMDARQELQSHGIGQEELLAMITRTFSGEVAAAICGALGGGSGEVGPDAAEVLRVVASGGRDGVLASQARAHVRGRLGNAEFQNALSALIDAGRVARHTVAPPGGGRPGVRLFAISVDPA